MHDHNHQCACGHHHGEDGCCHDHDHKRHESDVEKDREIASQSLPPSSELRRTSAMTEKEKHECVCGGECGCCEEEKE